MRVGVATIQRGRWEHLARQAEGVAAQIRPPDDYVVVSMDRGEASAVEDIAHGAGGRAARLPAGEPLPLALARNTAIAELGDVDLAILLDVDCIPGPDLVERYVAADRDGLLAAPVGRLGPGRPDFEAARANPGPQPFPPDGEVVAEPRVELFWSLSFAVRPKVHDRIGGFDTAYAGYGAEDTDYGFRARAAGVPLYLVGGGWAYHQHHPVSSPPVEHLTDIVRNANLFHARWGRWPMEGWLERFRDDGLVVWDQDVLRVVT